MRCPNCGHTWVRRANSRAGRKGGSAKAPGKGFGNPAHLARVLQARRQKTMGQEPASAPDLPAE